MNEDEIKAIIVRACKAYHGAMLDPYSEYQYTPDKAVEDVLVVLNKVLDRKSRDG